MRHNEHELQVGCMQYFRLQYPNELGFSIPNGAALSGNTTQRAKQMTRLKREGLLPGAADLVFFHTTKRPLFIEMKSATGKQSEYQEAFEVKADKVGNYIVIDNFQDFKAVIDRYYKITDSFHN